MARHRRHNEENQIYVTTARDALFVMFASRCRLLRWAKEKNYSVNFLCARARSQTISLVDLNIGNVFISIISNLLLLCGRVLTIWNLLRFSVERGKIFSHGSGLPSSLCRNILEWVQCWCDECVYKKIVHISTMTIS